MPLSRILNVTIKSINAIGENRIMAKMFEFAVFFTALYPSSVHHRLQLALLTIFHHCQIVKDAQN